MLDRGRLQFNGSCNDFCERETKFSDLSSQNLAFLDRRVGKLQTIFMLATR